MRTPTQLDIDTTKYRQRAYTGRVKSELARLRLRYHDQRLGAAKRGITWDFTFESWLAWWEATGKLQQRGCHRGQYVMARYGDQGPYSPANVRCATAEENHRERQALRGRLQ